MDVFESRDQLIRDYSSHSEPRAPPRERRRHPGDRGLPHECAGDYAGNVCLSARGGFGQFLRDAIIRDASCSADDKQQARRLRQEAESQLELLTEAENLTQSDFYSYRYFASEGFLPDYSFPRLPLLAYNRQGDHVDRRRAGHDHQSGETVPGLRASAPGDGRRRR